MQNSISLNTPFFIYTFSVSLSYYSTSPISLIWFPAPFFSLFPSLSYFSTSLFLFSGFLHRSSLVFLRCSSLDFLWFSPISPGYYLFFLGFSYQSFVLFMCSDDFFLWVSRTVLLWFPVVLSYFSRLLFLLFGFFLSKFSSFHVSDDFFLLWVSCTVLLWVSCGSLLFLQVIISSFWVFLIKVSFFSCF